MSMNALISAVFQRHLMPVQEQDIDRHRSAFFRKEKSSRIVREGVKIAIRDIYTTKTMIRTRNIDKKGFLLGSERNKKGKRVNPEHKSLTFEFMGFEGLCLTGITMGSFLSLWCVASLSLYRIKGRLLA